MDAFDEIPSALASRPVVMLATVIGTSGSTPASALSRMLIGGTGERLAGTIGGGCVEADVIRAAAEMASGGRSSVMTFTLDEDHPESGMLCGGTLDVFLEPLTGRDLPFVEALCARRDGGDDSVRGTLTGHDGVVRERFLIPPEPEANEGGSRQAWQPPPGLAPERGAILEGVAEILRRGCGLRLPVKEGSLVLDRVAGVPALFLFGGGHVARAVSRIAAWSGFRVTVIDDRPEFASRERFPEAARTIAADFTESFARIDIRPSSSIVIVTRGHKADELVLGVAATTPAGYVGMIGSRKKVAATFERLRSRGVPEEALRRVRTPIGIDIGAVTPGEIAVSVVAEMIHARRAAGRPLGFKSDRP